MLHTRSYLKFLMKLFAVLAALSLASGCGGGGVESDNPDDMIRLEGSISSSAPALSGPARAPLAGEGDMVFLYLNGEAVTSSQIKSGKYSFYGGYKGRRVSLGLGTSANEVYVGKVDSGATGTIVLPVFDEFAVITKYVIEVQEGEGRTSRDNFVISNGRIDVTSTINKVASQLSSKYVSDPSTYGYTKEETLQKIKNGTLNVSTAFSSNQLDVFAPLPKTFLISPLTAQCGRLETVAFTVSMTNFTNKSVIFKVNGVAGGDSVSGTISPSGLYTAPAAIDASRNVTITAQSVEDPAKEAGAVVMLLPVVVILNNGLSSITLGKTDYNYLIPSQVNGTKNTLLQWYINGTRNGGSVFGYVSDFGVFTRPSKIPDGRIIISAFSVADPSKYGTCEIILSN